jgi:NADP-dependent 3-hydroxy acid dehydrogenase YdfG
VTHEHQENSMNPSERKVVVVTGAGAGAGRAIAGR